jgi:tetratricopeptide (TPR) repeat protein
MARSGDAATARDAVGELAEIRHALTVAKGDYDWAKQVEIHHQAASAWLARAEGKGEEALRLMRSAADLEDATEKHPVTPSAILPAREMLGDLLNELNQPSLALTEYERSLESSPNRFNSVYGAARAAELAKNNAKARAYYEQLIALTVQADSSRPELQQIRKYLAKRGH